ncbi:MAG: WecB/TagA/CpsF family glycosyltransferase [Actinomycetota bacterium]|nr:WecB/TagA/CpsF family glycosyltransferase [Actinomycetota bacterium]
MSDGYASVVVLGVRFARLDATRALDRIDELCLAGPPAFVAHANVHTVNLAFSDPSYRDVLNGADLVLNDGKGVMLAARALGTPFPQDLNGNFFAPLVLRRAAEHAWPVFFFGARPGVAERAARDLEETLPGLEIVGVRDGYSAVAGDEDVVRAIRDSGAILLMVGLGNPAQEVWLNRHLHETGAKIGIGVGAFFDFQARAVPRAPRWMNRWGLEWIYRLAQEPRRMWRRYLVGNPLFLLRVLRGRWLRPKAEP